MGAEIVGQPMWLAHALNKIAGADEHIENHHAEQNPATAHMFIINPLSGMRMDNLFSTHPATENRIAALQELARSMGGGFGGPTSGHAGAGSAGPWSRGTRPAAGPWRNTGRGSGPWG